MNRDKSERDLAAVLEADHIADRHRDEARWNAVTPEINDEVNDRSLRTIPDLRSLIVRNSAREGLVRTPAQQS